MKPNLHYFYASSLSSESHTSLPDSLTASFSSAPLENPCTIASNNPRNRKGMTSNILATSRTFASFMGTICEYGRGTSVRTGVAPLFTRQKPCHMTPLEFSYTETQLKFELN